MKTYRLCHSADVANESKAVARFAIPDNASEPMDAIKDFLTEHECAFPISLVRVIDNQVIATCGRYFHYYKG